MAKKKKTLFEKIKSLVPSSSTGKDSGKKRVRQNMFTAGPNGTGLAAAKLPRPKKRFDVRIRNFLAEIVKEDGKDITREEALFESLYLLAKKKGNVPAYKEFFNRAFGKAKENIKLSADVNSGTVVDLSKLTKEQLELLRKLRPASNK